MRIVFDTNSKSWDTAKRWGIGIAILFFIFFISGLIRAMTGWDTDFFEGYFSAAHMVSYKWRAK